MNHGMEWIKKHKVQIVIGVILCVLEYGYYGKTTDTSVTTSATKTAIVERGDMRVMVSGSGQVEALSQVDLTPVIAGDGIDVLSVNVKNNQQVKKDQVIAVLDTKDAMRDVRNAELNLRSAQIKRKQIKEQFNSDTQVDSWNRQMQDIEVHQQENALSKAKEKLAEYSIKAPFDGIVTGLDVQAGDSVARDTVLASVITPEMKVMVTLNEVDAVKVVDGAVAQLTFDALPSVTLTGTVVKIATIGKVTQNVVSYDAEIAVDTHSLVLKPGMSVNADISVAERQRVLLVPNTAITTVNGKTTVKKTDQSVMKKSESNTDKTLPTTIIEVTTGLTNNVDTEITSGLSEGDTIVLPSVATNTSAAAGSGGILGSLFRGSGSNRGSR